MSLILKTMYPDIFSLAYECNSLFSLSFSSSLSSVEIHNVPQKKEKKNKQIENSMQFPIPVLLPFSYESHGRLLYEEV